MESQTQTPALTVFTPTYNRGTTLHRVYNSLIKQTYQDFEWLIIDDGSTDDTVAVVNAFIAQNKLLIRYEYQANGGKHVAHNRALDRSKGKFILVLDSDDAFANEKALETLLENWQKIPDDKKEGFVGVTGLCEDQFGNLVGDRFPSSPFDSNSIEKYYRYRIKGEKCGMMRTDVLRNFRFPPTESNSEMV